MGNEARPNEEIARSTNPLKDSCNEETLLEHKNGEFINVRGVVMGNKGKP